MTWLIAAGSVNSASSPRTISASWSCPATSPSSSPRPTPTTSSLHGAPVDQIRVYALGISSIDDEVQAVYQAAKELQEELRIDDLILPIDHLATRIYSQNREVAILEWLSLSSYYYWGSYDISDQNSSTNVTKSVHHSSELHSPAKVFTANNTPYFVNHLERLPSPTETFVRNYGPRLHHIALAVRDGETATGKTSSMWSTRSPPRGGLSARRHWLQGSGAQTDLLQRLGTLFPDHRVRAALR